MIKVFLKKILRYKNISFVFLVSFSLSVYSEEGIKFSDRIESYLLPNKLKVILLEDKRNPIVISSLWYKVGSSYETKGVTGISHILEHMMFKGTEKVKSGKFSEIIKNLGGTDNAFTGRDFTGYYQKVHKAHLEECLRMESDRMTNLILKETDFVKERKVVQEERRLRVEDRPISKAFEKTLLQAFGYHGYGIPIIGTMDDIENIKLNDLRSWYKNYYSPKNATLIVAGDFERSETKELINKYFGIIENNNSIPLNKETESHIIDFKDIILRDSVSNPTVLISFIQPKFNYNDRLKHYKMDLLLELIDGGSSSRLTKNLVDKKKVALETFISSDSYPIEESIVAFGGIPRDGVSVEKFRDEIFLQFKEIVKNGITDKEFNSLKSRLTSNNIYKLDSLFGQMMQIGILESKKIGWEILDTYLQDINQITKQDLVDTAKENLIDKEFIFTVIHPNR